jgi:hypothetical protein
MNHRNQIGFDRKLKLEWLDATAAQVARGVTGRELKAFLWKFLEGVVAGETSDGARRKTITVLSHIWAQVPPGTVALRDSALLILPEVRADQRLAVHWALTIASYPFFAAIASATGRLLALQGNASLAQVTRRVAEQWGDRESVQRTARQAVRTMVEWDALTETATKGVYQTSKSAHAVETRVVPLVVEALLLGTRQESIPTGQIKNHPALFPFKLELNTHSLRSDPRLSVHRHGLDVDVVGLCVNRRRILAPATRRSSK